MEAKRSWPFVEATKILARSPNKRHFIFETGYGPSGLPHIGTFGEVVRTIAVMRALRELLPDSTAELLAVSDDMDGLRKVPDNVPNRSMVAQYLGMPLTNIPDPFNTHESYGKHMNVVFCEFLDRFDFKYTFVSSTECYKKGIYDKVILNVLANYDSVMQIMLPTLGEERQQTYSPFLPVCQKTGKVLQVPILEHDPVAGTVTYRDDDDKLCTVPVTGGMCKLQWKPDWGMRWVAFDVDYEAHGKDLTPTAVLSSKICTVLGKQPPILFCYELFLDAEGKKVSKSKGNGLSIDDWMEYSPRESLALYMLRDPQKAKKLYFDVIPQSTDEYIRLIESYHANPNPDNFVWHIHDRDVPEVQTCGLNFSLLLNLAGACNAENVDVLWGFIKNYAPIADQVKHSFLYKMAQYAVKYYHAFVKPTKVYKIPTADDVMILQQLKHTILNVANDATAEVLQTKIFELGNKSTKLQDWFSNMYHLLLGQRQGPRLGSFISLYGISNTVALIDDALKRQA